MTAAELAKKLGYRIEGTDRELTGAAPVDSAESAELTFVAGPKWFAIAADSHAGCVIAPLTYEPSTGQTVIRGEDPRALFAQALTLLYPRGPSRPGTHASAQVAPDARVAPTSEIGAFCTIESGAAIGPDTRVGPGCHVGRNAQIGADGVLHAGVVIAEGTLIGDRVILHPGCVVGSDGFGFARHNGRWVKFPQVGRVQIGDDVEIGANSCVDRAALGWTRIGSGTKLDNMVHVGHNCTIGRDVVIAAQTGLSGGVTVGDGAIIGGQVGIGDQARIEPGVVLGSGSGVLTSKIVRAGEPLWGTPARPLREYLEQLALFAKLPEFRAELRTLRARLEKLEEGGD